MRRRPPDSSQSHLRARPAPRPHPACPGCLQPHKTLTFQPSRPILGQPVSSGPALSLTETVTYNLQGLSAHCTLTLTRPQAKGTKPPASRRWLGPRPWELWAEARPGLSTHLTARRPRALRLGKAGVPGSSGMLAPPAAHTPVAPPPRGVTLPPREPELSRAHPNSRLPPCSAPATGRAAPRRRGICAAGSDLRPKSAVATADIEFA